MITAACAEAIRERHERNRRETLMALLAGNGTIRDVATKLGIDYRAAQKRLERLRDAGEIGAWSDRRIHVEDEDIADRIAVVREWKSRLGRDLETHELEAILP